ncbi:MAG: pyridoxal phosphate-dependent aminotransferase family protein [Sodaliphilus pleomorphus]|jgi:8-amino-7-oxononanoate synthase|uniref:Pyridoxal phosphate-dependent aminotransferase family protein n=1 Tax=Sodaliphilus pleomorphus TaxID=2606626 RepID=A0A6L5XCP3_9BACT|nr:pyridoxal phosphate-dependent aminotransferase family protein [Sodaliphilus pleomorphus]MCI5980091.1 pyridoxal phosphate-dependent aminotransferase family protein [Muribaculaceae bacterium]MDY6252299.1 pyridoxal phosphate-dependent aminotransferase family protein [Bacteroidales bacterium]MCI6169010.1 pyridoxal phosphate-dependent aminotransferase family protein [Muribaculaceae bacterium]MDD6475711.1 pyridoxal phosphate-dependent aminotransferase family protein [Sodaliphilus pleomorphus]MDD6
MKLLQAKLAKYDEPQKAKALGIYPYFRAISSEQDTEVIMNGKKVLMFGSNCYSGLVNDKRVHEAAIEAIRKYGTGCAGSPFLNGTLDIHKELEQKLAAYEGKEDAMIYSTGFEVNLGVVSTVTGRDDYILWDEQDHASIIEGRRLSFSNSLKYKHNDMASLETQLKKCDPDRVKLIVTDGVFSMEGDVCKLPDIVDLAHKYKASIMVDEAHGIGVFGEGGRGVCDHFGLKDEVDIIMGTFSKSFASLGGFVATDKIITNYLRHHSRSYIFTASITPASTAAVSKALDIMIAEPERQEHLWEITKFALEGFREMGCEIGHTETPIIPLFIRDNNKTFAITRDLLNEGIFVNPVVSPAVAPNDTLIRFSLMATHTKAQVETALEKIHKVFRSYGLVK